MVLDNVDHALPNTTILKPNIDKLEYMVIKINLYTNCAWTFKQIDVQLFNMRIAIVMDSLTCP